MMQIALIGLGAGLAAALLFASIATGSLLAMLLFYLAPLPILIAALGWSHWAGLLAAFIAATGLGAILEVYFFSAFLIGVGLPAWWLGYLTMLARPVASFQGAPDMLEWYPPGRLVLWAALVGALVVAIAIPSFGTDKETFQAGLRRAFERAIRMQPEAAAPASRPETDRLVDLLVVVIPPAAAVLATLLNAVNLRLAARIVNVSGRLRRPWPDLSALALPGIASGLLALAVVGMFLPDLLGILSMVFAASLVMAFAIMGFAVLHAITRGMGSRTLLLAGAYVTVVLAGWPLLVMALLGLSESALDLRGRLARRRGPPTQST
jgi:hypothetical protein